MRSNQAAEASSTGPFVSGGASSSQKERASAELRHWVAFRWRVIAAIRRGLRGMRIT